MNWNGTLHAFLLGVVCTASGQVAKKVAAPSIAGAAASVQASNGSQPGQPTAPTPATAQKIAMLPEPFPPGLIQGIDTAAQSQAILSHLSETVRYYRMAVVPIQKIGEPSDVLYAQQTGDEATQIGQIAFQAARSQAGFLVRIPGKQLGAGQAAAGETNRTTEVLRSLSQKLTALQSQETALDSQIAKSRTAEREHFRTRREMSKDKSSSTQRPSERCRKFWRLPLLAQVGWKETSTLSSIPCRS